MSPSPEELAGRPLELDHGVGDGGVGDHLADDVGQLDRELGQGVGVCVVHACT